MPGDTDLTKLSKKQLISLVQLRGQAIEFHSNADGLLLEKIENETIEAGDFEKFFAAKVDILASLMEAEEEVLDRLKGQTFN